MSRYDFCHTLTDSVLGISVIHDIDCQVEVSTEPGRRPFVDAVYIGGKNLFKGNATSRSIAAEIALAAEDELDRHGRLLMAVLDRDAGDASFSRASGY